MVDEQDEKVQGFLSELDNKLRNRPLPALKQRKAQANMNQVEMVLPAVLSKLGLDRKMKEHALMQVWDSLLPQAIARRSRPIFMDYQNNLVIAVKDASTAQELSLLKTKLLQTIAPTARSLGVELRGVRIDMKNYHQVDEQNLVEEVVLPHQPSDAELKNLPLNENDKRLIAQLDENFAHAGRKDEISFKVGHIYEMQLRLAEWRRQNGYPICQLCNNPVTRLFARDGHKVCFNCSQTE
jgi:hypothetical protein